MATTGTPTTTTTTPVEHRLIGGNGIYDELKPIALKCVPPSLRDAVLMIAEEKLGVIVRKDGNLIQAERTGYDGFVIERRAGVHVHQHPNTSHWTKESMKSYDLIDLFTEPFSRFLEALASKGSLVVSIDGRIVEYLDNGDVKVGCQTIPHEAIALIAAESLERQEKSIQKALAATEAAKGHPGLQAAENKPMIPHDEIDYYVRAITDVSESERIANNKRLRDRWQNNHFPVQYWRTSYKYWSDVDDPNWADGYHYRRGPVATASA
jgi:hypothetical protein